MKTESSIASGLSSVAIQRRQQDLQYINEEMTKASDDVVTAISTLLRSGTFFRSLSLAEQLNDTDESKGELIKHKVRTVKGLFDKTLSDMLKILEPQVFSDEALENLTRTYRRELLCFAINTKESCSLPDHQDTVSSQSPLQVM